MTVHDTITADQLEIGDLAVIHGDQTEVHYIEDYGQNIFVRALSHESGDIVEYTLGPDEPIDLWSA